jgi:hypothetical protein
MLTHDMCPGVSLASQSSATQQLPYLVWAIFTPSVQNEAGNSKTASEPYSIGPYTSI